MPDTLLRSTLVARDDSDIVQVIGRYAVTDLGGEEGRLLIEAAG